jgi:hypothetical protein
MIILILSAGFRHRLLSETRIVVCLILGPVFVLCVEGYSAEEERGQDRGIVVGKPVRVPRSPSFFSSGPAVTPGNDLSTRKAVKHSRSTFANTVYRPAIPPVEMNCFIPFKT